MGYLKIISILILFLLMISKTATARIVDNRLSYQNYTSIIEVLHNDKTLNQKYEIINNEYKKIFDLMEIVILAFFLVLLLLLGMSSIGLLLVGLIMFLSILLVPKGLFFVIILLSYVSSYALFPIIIFIIFPGIFWMIIGSFLLKDLFKEKKSS